MWITSAGKALRWPAPHRWCLLFDNLVTHRCAGRGYQLRGP
ncbi:hypothetical protein Pd630_LPD11079 (plasmid) [Rhodococcus opacus PD630]|nr:hypothetical protein Pd630_LPD11079 [Rhodococcus opacus PD630]